MFYVIFFNGCVQRSVMAVIVIWSPSVRCAYMYFYLVCFHSVCKCMSLYVLYWRQYTDHKEIKFLGYVLKHEHGKLHATASKGLPVVVDYIFGCKVFNIIYIHMYIYIYVANIYSLLYQNSTSHFNVAISMQKLAFTKRYVLLCTLTNDNQFQLHAISTEQQSIENQNKISYSQWWYMYPEVV